MGITKEALSKQFQSIDQANRSTTCSDQVGEMKLSLNPRNELAEKTLAKIQYYEMSQLYLASQTSVVYPEPICKRFDFFGRVEHCRNKSKFRCS